MRHNATRDRLSHLASQVRHFAAFSEVFALITIHNAEILRLSEILRLGKLSYLYCQDYFLNKSGTVAR